MSDWDSAQYLKFEAQRTQPAEDLANRAKFCRPQKVVDIGCGPGNSTAVLRSVFPGAAVLGIDNSPNMIARAREQYPQAAFQVCDAQSLPDRYDLIFSNACLQWIPNHEVLIPNLMKKLNPHGALAVQIPMNGGEPLFQMIEEVAAEAKWGFGQEVFEANRTLKPDEYFDLLSDCSSSFQVWETVYYHHMPSHQSLVEWVKGTRLRPYLAALDSEGAAAFEKEIARRAAEIYPVRKNGGVVLRFRRFFFIAVSETG